MVSLFRVLLTLREQSRQLIAVLRAALGKLGISPKVYGAHSFRIGAATDAKRDGKSDKVVMDLGRWSSHCYKLNITPSNKAIWLCCGSSHVRITTLDCWSLIVRWAVKQAESRCFDGQLSLDGARVKILWGEGVG
ncbi:hypothetical protein NDU88_007869 [Pleurodeles waltl]|uniref:Uncharacterized protein n=1 Tax=Pleurodeles waltl TaxID=8319 RepID=A0AAV7RVA5_PLEWA|nr:hypothetical protein NDU88_007869 [Pleurodeles waltl]